MSITATIKSIQDIMRKDSGVDGDAQRISQLTWMIFWKIFDDREKELELEDYKSRIPERLRYRTWAYDEKGMTGDKLLDFINNDLFKTLKEINISEPKSKGEENALVVKAVFGDAYNYMKNGTLLRQVINKLNEIDFNNLKQKGEFSKIYEEILRGLQSAGNAGEFYTPRAVTQFMTDILNPVLGEKVLDPACGTGGFLTSAIDHIRSKFCKTAEDEDKMQKSVTGIEKKQMPHMLCVTNMLLHNIDIPSNIKHDNTLSKPLTSWSPSDRVEVVLTNPPFGGNEEDGIESNFPKVFQTRETADLFLVFIMRILKDNGRCGLVLPDGFLFGEGVKTKIKETLLKEFNLHTIVRLPNGVFSPYTSIKTNLLFFEKGGSTKEIWFYEHPYPEGVKSYNKSKPIDISEFEPEKKWWNNRAESEQAWRVEAETIIKNNYNLDIKNPNKKEAALEDPEVLLKSYETVMKEMADTQTKLKDALYNALKEAGSVM